MRVLVGDDQSDVLEAARLLLKSGGHVAVTASTPKAVLEQARQQAFDLLLLDMNYARDTTSGGEGLDLITGLRSSGVHAPVVVMTAWSSVEIAVEAMRRGAIDFVQKPWDNRRLLATIDRYGSQPERDTDVARRVQQTMLGRCEVPVAGLDYAGRSMPLGPIGGDYYDFIDPGDGSLGIALADVSGKGVSAALLMAHLQSGLRSRPDLVKCPVQMMDAVNHVFWKSSPSEQYATVFYGVYSPESRILHYVNAGHSAPLLLRASGAVETLESTGMPVGMFGAWHGEAQSVRLIKGDRIAIISDGVVEAGLREEREFGVEGIADTLRKCSRKNASETAEAILCEAGRRGTDDDMTAVVLNAV
jgi:sigma-B regulation protein RsbU (phosphoserine phosphatase)